MLQDADSQIDNKLVKYTAEFIKPMQNEIQTLKDRLTKSEKDQAHFKQFEKMNQD